MNLNLTVLIQNNLSKIKNGADIIYLDEYESTGTHWIALYENAENVTYLDSFGVEHVPKEVTNSLEISNTYRIQAYGLITYGDFLYWIY